jgi:predicted nucleic acid-binding protein
VGREQSCRTTSGGAPDREESAVILLDSSFLIRALVVDTEEARALHTWLSEGQDVVASTIGWAEFLCGPLTREQRDLASIVVASREPFTAEDASRAADLFNATGRRRGTFADCMIAATALRLGAAVATSNRADFRRFERLGLHLSPP